MSLIKPLSDSTDLVSSQVNLEQVNAEPEIEPKKIQDENTKRIENVTREISSGVEVTTYNLSLKSPVKHTSETGVATITYDFRTK